MAKSFGKYKNKKICGLFIKWGTDINEVISHSYNKIDMSKVENAYCYFCYITIENAINVIAEFL